MAPTLRWEERLHYRDRLRQARYAALADAEGFGDICFVIESIGLRLQGHQATMGSYKPMLRVLAEDSEVLSDIAPSFPALLSSFNALYETVLAARNDAMHTGVYARHATTAAIELCIGLEEALVKAQQIKRTCVADFMVRSPVTVEPWQPVAYARQLMLMHSFSFLPVSIEGHWMLIPETSMAKYLPRDGDPRKYALGRAIGDAITAGALEAIAADVVAPGDDVAGILAKAEVSRPALWLVADDKGRLAGVLSPFELM